MKEQREIIKWLREEELKAQKLLRANPSSGAYFSGMILAFKKTRDHLEKEND